MKKTFKSIVSAVIAVVTLSTASVSMTASATQFAFNLGRGGSDYKTASKGNYLDYANVNVTGGNLSNSSFMNFCLKSTSNTSMSASKKRTGTGSFNLSYTTTSPSVGKKVRLQGNAGYYGGQASGSFTP